MPLNLISAFILGLCATALMSSAVVVLSWRYRERPGANALGLIAGTVTLIAAGYAAELASGTLERILLAAYLQYIGIVLLPVFWLWFALNYTGRDAWLHTSHRYFLFIIPAVTLALVLTNTYHGLIWRQIALSTSGARVFFDPDYGPWFWVHTIYSYSLILPATGLLVFAAWRTHRHFRRQALVLTTAALAPLLGNALYLFRIGPGQTFDLTPLFFGLSVILVTLLVTRGRLLEVMPVARGLTFEQMRDGVVVLDPEGRVVDLNLAASTLFNRAIVDVIGQPITLLMPIDATILNRYLSGQEIEEELAIKTEQGQRWFTIRVITLRGWRGRLKGRLIQWRDVTARRQSEEILHLRNAELEALHEAAIMLGSRQDTSRVLEVIVAHAAALVGVRDGYVAVLDQGADVMKIEVGVGLFAGLVGLQLKRNEGLVGHVWASGQPLLVDDYAAWEHRLPIGEQLAAVFGLPLVDQEQVVGVIGLCYTERGPTFDAPFRTLLDRFARLASLALKNARLYASFEQELAERRRTELALAQARDLAEASSRAKSTFINNMSHELRTPLTSIIGYAQLIKLQLGAGDTASIASELDIIVNAARHQVTMINNLLDLAKIEAGHMQLHTSRFSLELLLHETGQIVKPLIEQTHNRLFIEASDSLGLIYSDQQKIRQILINLLSNAAKFTEYGTISLYAARVELDGHSWVQLSVTDTGVGIPAPLLSTIFEEFTQVDSPNQRKYSGTGLGLAICRRYAELMGGWISVESKEHHGTSFYVNLPYVHAAELGARPGNPSEAGDRALRSNDGVAPGRQSA
jgi:PAS domain S-box-containing protein